MTADILDLDADLHNADWTKRAGRDDTFEGILKRLKDQAIARGNPAALAKIAEAEALVKLGEAATLLEYNPDQERDEQGRFTSSGGGAGTSLGGPKTLSLPQHAEQGHGDIIARPASVYHVANPQGLDTQSKFKQANGQYTEQRQQLHRAIVSQFAHGVTPTSQPTAYLTGGGSASGKGAIVKENYFGMADPKNAVHIDADEIKSKIPDYRDMVARNDSNAAAHAHEESSDISQQLIAHAAAKGQDMVYDSTGDGSVEKLEKKVNQMKAGGHRIVAHYMTVDTDEAIRRSDARAEKTGRFVPHENIKALHASVSRVVPQAIERGLFDKFTLWDNNADGQKPRIIASAVGKNLTVHDQTAWQKFIDKGKE